MRQSVRVADDVKIARHFSAG